MISIANVYQPAIPNEFSSLNLFRLLPDNAISLNETSALSPVSFGVSEGAGNINNSNGAGNNNWTGIAWFFIKLSLQTEAPLILNYKIVSNSDKDCIG